MTPWYSTRFTNIIFLQYIIMKKIWILWGMWPQASLNFYELLIQKTKIKFKTPRNQDYPHIMLSNIPVIDLIESKIDMQKTIKEVSDEAIALEKWWVSLLVMTCNTMHLFEDEITAWVNIPFISIIDSVINKVWELWVKKIWLLWSKTTIQSNLYQTPLKNIWIKTISLSEIKQDKISKIVLKYISWSISSSDIQDMDGYCKELNLLWAEAIILWCTELPLIMKNLFNKYKLYSSTDILAEIVMKEYYK